MRKFFLGVCSIALVAGTMTSCGKTTKGKLSEEWNVAKIENKSTNISSSGNTTTNSSVITIDGTNLTRVTTNSNGTTTTTGTVSKYAYIINKDGTFEIAIDVTYVTSGTGYTETTKQVRTTTGTWSFVDKNKTDEFKKNERVIFNTLSVAETNTSTLAYSGTTTSTTTSNSNSSSYIVGENSSIYTVEESTGKTLVLVREHSSSSTGSNGTNSSSGSATITLEK